MDFIRLVKEHVGKEGLINGLRLCIHIEGPWDLVWSEETEKFVVKTVLGGVRKRFREWVRKTHSELRWSDQFGHVTAWEEQNLEWACDLLGLSGWADVDNAFVFKFPFPTSAEALGGPGTTEALREAFEEAARDVCCLMRASAAWNWGGGVVWGKGESANPLGEVHEGEAITLARS